MEKTFYRKALASARERELGADNPAEEVNHVSQNNDIREDADVLTKCHADKTKPYAEFTLESFLCETCALYACSHLVVF